MKPFRLNYVLIPLVTVFVALIGSYLTSKGMSWYNTELIQPSLTPPRWAFPVAWNIIFVLTTISAVLLWNVFKKRTKVFYAIFALFVLNAVLNVAWSALFFVMHNVFASLIEMMVMELSTLAIMVLSYKYSKLAAFLLLPYFLWVGFATYLTYLIMQAN